MARVVAAFIIVCMVVIAASVGVVAFLQLGIGIGEAALLSFIAFLVTLLVQFEATRRRERRRIALRFDEILEHFEATADEIGNVERRLLKLEANATPDRSAELDPVLAEVEVLGTIVTQLAEQLTDVETRVTEVQEYIRQAPVAPVDEIAQEPAPRTMPEPERLVDEEEDDRQPSIEPDQAALAKAAAARKEILVAVVAALDAGRIELHMQPIVTFPQRHIRYYETLTRLMTEDGAYLYPEHFLDIAENARLMPQIDRFVMQHASRIVRRLSQRNRRIGLFCNLSATSLMDSQFFTEFTKFLELNRDLVEQMVFELSQDAVRDMGPMELETLAELRDMGCRFSLEHVGDLHIDFSDLAGRGFRFVKVAATRLLDENSPARADIHVADLAALAARYGIEIIADHIEREAQVIGLLDFEVKFGQGGLFSPPKPVRPDVLAALPGSTGGSTGQEHRRAAG